MCACCLYFPEELKLVPLANNYSFLNKSGCIEVDTRDDVEDFKIVKVHIYIFDNLEGDISRAR